MIRSAGSGMPHAFVCPFVYTLTKAGSLYDASPMGIGMLACSTRLVQCSWRVHTPCVPLLRQQVHNGTELALLIHSLANVCSLTLRFTQQHCSTSSTHMSHMHMMWCTNQHVPNLMFVSPAEQLAHRWHGGCCVTAGGPFASQLTATPTSNLPR